MHHQVRLARRDHTCAGKATACHLLPVCVPAWCTPIHPGRPTAHYLELHCHILHSDWHAWQQPARHGKHRADSWSGCRSCCRVPGAAGPAIALLLPAPGASCCLADDDSDACDGEGQPWRCCMPVLALGPCTTACLAAGAGAAAAGGGRCRPPCNAVHGQALQRPL